MSPNNVFGEIIRLQHPDTGAVVQCGPYTAYTTVVAGRAPLRECVNDYILSGYVRIPETVDYKRHMPDTKQDKQKSTGLTAEAVIAIKIQESRSALKQISSTLNGMQRDMRQESTRSRAKKMLSASK